MNKAQHYQQVIVQAQGDIAAAQAAMQINLGNGAYAKVSSTIGGIEFFSNQAFDPASTATLAYDQIETLKPWLIDITSEYVE